METVNQPHIHSYENLQDMDKMGWKKCKQESDYHRRSLFEISMLRMKIIFGGSLRRRNFDV
ncbi:hypothetical protein [Mastigocoleus testarum]|uniref:Uncharacterized protein n=1 Tax=Mastigocoleus testarum BC008 TaxID=371196 RepID=A0A0V7ZWD5_9CYAN|nr:hypothetical protein [Mastigocoleus testarum]KST68514.1 hypothetical protein BC008_01205 [Mastigocoleus testarum BC008]KST68663.1 hypothetical protein BC008_01520 [Mastigocoleus testarum BC008]